MLVKEYECGPEASSMMTSFQTNCLDFLFVAVLGEGNMFTAVCFLWEEARFLAVGVALLVLG
jgi:hypothetical protein